jgi:hypothetical protein
MIEHSRSNDQTDIQGERFADGVLVRNALQAACRNLSDGDLDTAIANFSKSELSLKDLRAQSNIIEAAKEGVKLNLENGDKDTASRIYAIFGLSSREFPELSRQGAFLHSPVQAPSGGVGYAAVEMRDEILKQLSEPQTFKIDKVDGHQFHTKSFAYPKLKTEGAIEVYTNPKYLEKISSAGLETPQVMALIRPPGLFKGFYMRIQILAEEFPLKNGKNDLSAELTDTLYHELCHHGQETYRRENPNESLPEIKYGHLDSKPGFSSSFAYFVECPDEVGAFVREAGFRATRQGISIGEGLSRTIDQQVRLSGVDGNYSVTEESILRTCMQETYQRVASDLWPSKRIVIPS